MDDPEDDGGPVQLDYGRGMTRVSRFDLPTFFALLLVFSMLSVVEFFVIPGFEGIFRDAHAKLPGFTQIAFATADWFKKGAWIGLVVLLFVIPTAVAALRRGAPPTVRSARLAVRISIFLFTLLVGYFVLAIGIPVITLTTTVPEH